MQKKNEFTYYLSKDGRTVKTNADSLAEAKRKIAAGGCLIPVLIVCTLIGMIL